MSRIMIIDDDQEFLTEINEMLEGLDYATNIFYEAEEALKSIESLNPDLILLDLKMDKMNGFQFADRFKNFPEFNKIPMIAMTGHYTKKEHKVLIKVSGIREVLLKPLYPLDLIARLEKALAEKNEKEMGLV